MTELRYSEIRSIAAGGADTHDFLDDVKPHKNVDPKPVASASGTDTGLSERDQLIELFCDARDKLMKAVPESEWKRLGIGYGPVSGQVFPEACAFELSDIGPQGEPLFRYSEDQPRDPDGKFESGGFENKGTVKTTDKKVTTYSSPNHTIVIEHDTKESKVIIKHLDKDGDLLTKQTHDSIGAARKELQSQGIDHKFHALRYSSDQSRDPDGIATKGAE
jgi:hypothetical protein